MNLRENASTWRQSNVVVILAIIIISAACAPFHPEYDETDAVSPYAETAFDVIRVGPDTARVGDCNGNGLIDHLEVHPFGFGYAETHGPFSTEENPVQVLAADLDGDRRPELIALNQGESDYRDGSLSFTSGVFTVHEVFHAILPIHLSDFRHPRCFVTADFNGDRAVDIAVLFDSGLYGDPHLATLYNAGDGTFPVDAIAVESVSGSSARCLSKADLDGDGDEDLLATVVRVDTSTDTPTPMVLLRRNEGAAGLSDLWHALGLAGVDNIPISGPGSILAADVDDDGDLDAILTINQSPGMVVVRFNTGDIFSPDGSAYDVVIFEVGNGPMAVAAGDLNGDGRTDLAVSNANSGDISLLLNAGRYASIERDASDFFEPAVSIPLEHQLGQIVMSDLNGDGDLDLAIARTGSDDVAILINRGDATFFDPLSVAVGTGPRSIVAARLWRAAFPDLVTANIGSNNMSVLRNQAQPAVSPDCNSNGRPDSCDIASHVSADEDGNGIPDECPTFVLRPPSTPVREPVPLP